jgi:CheY-like chemotaxis protein
MMAPAVLLVEDDPATREMMVLLLDLEGFTAVPVANGIDALHYLQNGGAARVILLDLMTPTMDGWAFRREQRKDDRIRDIPVIVLSAHDTATADGDLDAAAAFRKPVDVGEVVGAIRRVCPT